MELGTISEMNFSDYFLIVADFIRAAREMDVWVGPEGVPLQDRLWHIAWESRW